MKRRQHSLQAVHLPAGGSLKMDGGPPTPKKVCLLKVQSHPPPPTQLPILVPDQASTQRGQPPNAGEGCQGSMMNHQSLKTDRSKTSH